MLITQTTSFFKDGASAEIRGVRGKLYFGYFNKCWYFVSNSDKDWARTDELVRPSEYKSATMIAGPGHESSKYIVILLDEINNHSWYTTKDKSKLQFGPAIFKTTVGLLVQINICGRESWAFVSNNKVLDGGSTSMSAQTEKYKDSFAYIYIIEQSGELIDYVRIAISEKTHSYWTKYNPSTFEPVTGPIPTSSKLETNKPIPEKKPIIPDLDDEAPLFKRITLTPNKIN